MTTPRTKSIQAKFDEQGFSALRDDVVGMARVLADKSVTYVTGRERAIIPVDGTATVYAVSTVTTTGSDALNNWTIDVLRNDQYFPNTWQIITSRTEVVKFQKVCLASGPVSSGDIITMSVVQLGAPSALLASDWMLLIVIT